MIKSPHPLNYTLSRSDFYTVLYWERKQLYFPDHLFFHRSKILSYKYITTCPSSNLYLYHYQQTKKLVKNLKGRQEIHPNRAFAEYVMTKRISSTMVHLPVNHVKFSFVEMVFVLEFVVKKVSVHIIIHYSIDRIFVHAFSTTHVQ
jgi:hypothetical protein